MRYIKKYAQNGHRWLVNTKITIYDSGMKFVLDL
jgi:hypothetical protein